MIGVPPKFSFTFEGATFNIYHADSGEGIPKHEHDYSHATVCASGCIKVTKDAKTLEINKLSKPILLKENEWHEIEATEPNTVFINIFKTQ